MKKTLTVLVLTFVLAFASLALAVQADTALTLSVAAQGGDYTSIESALSAVETMAKKGELNAKGVVLVLTGEHTATAKNGVLFGQKTIFLPTGRKLPITVQGADATLRMPQGEVACANDYTFTNLKIPFDDEQTKFYAGSGNVTLKNLTLDLNGTANGKSCFYADTFTANVFEGWDTLNLNSYQKNGKLYSSLTLGEGFDYQTADYSCAAVGASADFSAVIGSKTLSSDDMRTELIVDGATLKTPLARVGKNPVGESVLWLKSGSINHLYAVAPNATVLEHTGDITVLTEGGRIRHFARILNKVTLKGNLSVMLRNVNFLENPDVDDARMIEIGFAGANVIGDVTVYLENVKADRYYGAMAGKNSKVTGDLNLTVRNCEFTKHFLGGFGQSTICGNVKNTFENVSFAPLFYGLDECPALGVAADYTGRASSVGNVTTAMKNVTFSAPEKEVASYLLAKVSCAVAGNVVNTLENVTTQGKHSLYLSGYNGTVSGNVTNTVKSGSFSHYLYGGPYLGTVKGTLRNNVEGGTYFQEVYLGGYSCTVSGRIENRVSGGHFDTLYLFCGTRSGNVTNTSIPYAIENYFTGGSFVGVWGGGGNAIASVLSSNIYNEISGGFFDTYNTTEKNNSFAGSVRNGTHNGNVDTLIRGGTFTGYVFGGSIPNQESWGHQHNGTSTLTLAGGDFRYQVHADCRWGNFKETHLYVNTEKALDPLALEYDLTCESFIAANDSKVSIQTKTVTCRELIARGKKPLQVFGEVICDSFFTEPGAAAPEIYGKVSAKKLNCNGTPLIVGAKGRVDAEEVIGSVSLYQSEYWLARTYFTSPAETSVTASQGETVYGNVIVKNGTVTGESSAFEGVSFLFDEKISLRFFFNKKWVDDNRDSFTFSARCGERAITKNVVFSDLVLKNGYYTVLSDTFSATELGEKITAEGTMMETRVFTLGELADAGIRIYGKEGQNEELSDLLKAFANYRIHRQGYCRRIAGTVFCCVLDDIHTGFSGCEFAVLYGHFCPASGSILIIHLSSCFHISVAAVNGCCGENGIGFSHQGSRHCILCIVCINRNDGGTLILVRELTVSVDGRNGEITGCSPVIGRKNR